MSETKIHLEMLLADINAMPPERQEKIRHCLAKLEMLIDAHSDDCYIAMSIIGLRSQVEAEETSFSESEAVGHTATAETPEPQS